MTTRAPQHRAPPRFPAPVERSRRVVVGVDGDPAVLIATVLHHPRALPCPVVVVPPAHDPTPAATSS